MYPLKVMFQFCMSHNVNFFVPVLDVEVFPFLIIKK